MITVTKRAVKSKFVGEPIELCEATKRDRRKDSITRRGLSSFTKRSFTARLSIRLPRILSKSILPSIRFSRSTKTLNEQTVYLITKKRSTGLVFALKEIVKCLSSYILRENLNN